MTYMKNWYATYIIYVTSKMLATLKFAMYDGTSWVTRMCNHLACKRIESTRLTHNNKYIFTANEKLRLAIEFQFEGTSRMHNPKLSHCWVKHSVIINIIFYWNVLLFDQSLVRMNFFMEQHLFFLLKYSFITVLGSFSEQLVYNE